MTLTNESFPQEETTIELDIHNHMHFLRWKTDSALQVKTLCVFTYEKYFF